MQNSVSSQPIGRLAADRPIPFWNPPAIWNASRRNEAFPPSRFRTGARVSGMPRYAAPTTQANSAGNQDGRRACQFGSVRPPTPMTAGSA